MKSSSLANFILFQKGIHTEGLRLIPALIVSALIIAIGFLGLSYFLHLIDYPGFEFWFW